MLGTSVHDFFFSIYSISSFIVYMQSSFSKASSTYLGLNSLSKHVSLLILFLVITPNYFSPIIFLGSWFLLTYFANTWSFLLCSSTSSSWKMISISLSLSCLSFGPCSTNQHCLHDVWLPFYVTRHHFHVSQHHCSSLHSSVQPPLTATLLEIAPRC